MTMVIKPWRIQNIDIVLKDIRALLEEGLDPIEEYIIIRLQYLLLKYRELIVEKIEEEKTDLEGIMSKGKAVIYIDDFRSIKDIDPDLIRRGNFKLCFPRGKSTITRIGEEIEDTVSYESVYVVFDGLEDTEHGILPVFRG